mmetsp:Transcript_28737/g.72162  ORF Transcript_28737/g.72162 Transcript_28737/m.72162 type:complete len:140 (-) Transcript_28737:238-657(-)
MGGVNFSSQRPQPTPPTPVIFYKEDFFKEYGSASPAAPPTASAAPAAPSPSDISPDAAASASMKASERARILAEIREEELHAAEAAAKRIGAWATALQARTVPCSAEQVEVERCYAAHPGNDQLRCGPAVDAFVQCAKL